MARREVATFESIQNDLQDRENDIAAILPKHIPPERFQAAALAAIKQNTGLLSCTPRTLFGAITFAAQDGLMPDGREGYIGKYSTKVKKVIDGQKREVWEDHANWNPMYFGMKKRAREIDEILVSAAVVYSNDYFLWRQGDDEALEHTATPLGEDRGERIGCYAIFRREGVILHREVMTVDEIEAVRAISKQPEGLMWGQFTDEAWKKSVGRRGFKSVPSSPAMDQILARDDQNFVLDPNERALIGAPEAQETGSQRLPPPRVGAAPDPRSRRQPAEVVSGPREAPPPAVQRRGAGYEEEPEDLHDEDEQDGTEAEAETASEGEQEQEPDAGETVSEPQWFQAKDGSGLYECHGGDPTSAEAKKVLYERLRQDFEPRDWTADEVSIALDIAEANRELIGTLRKPQREKLEAMWAAIPSDKLV